MFWKKKKNVKPVKDFGIETANYGPLPYIHLEKFEHFSENPDEEGRRLLEGFDDEQLDEYSGSLADPFIESLAEIDEFIKRLGLHWGMNPEKMSAEELEAWRV